VRDSCRDWRTNWRTRAFSPSLGAASLALLDRLNLAFQSHFPQQKTPRLGRGASGVTTGRRDMYLYICGSVGGRWALMCRRALIVGSDEGHGAALNPARKFCVPLCIVISM